jgi:hypothetical protein
MNQNLDECQLLPIYDPSDTEETFAAKLAQLQKEQLEERASLPLQEDVIYMPFAVPSKLYRAFQKTGRRQDYRAATKVFENLFKQCLVKLWYEGKEHE